MKLGRTLAFVAALVAMCLILFVAIRPAEGHDFYSQACCSKRDCGPVLAGVVTWTPTGWLVAHLNLTVPFDDRRIQYTPPGVPMFHICMVGKSDMLRCLYIPTPEG